MKFKKLEYDHVFGTGDGRISKEVDFLEDMKDGELANKSSCLQMIEMQGRYPKVRKEVHISKSRKNHIAFSPNGEYLIILKKESNNQTLDIYQLGDDEEALERCLDEVEKDKPFRRIKNTEANLSNLKHIRFSPDSTYLALFGSKRVIVILL